VTELLTAAQMRAIEQAAIESGEVTGLELMERAGAGVVEAIFEWRPELAEGDRRAVVLCGPGNNGGDGFVVARLLKQRGWTVEVYLYGDEAKLPPDAAENCRRWREAGEVQHLAMNETRFDTASGKFIRLSEYDLTIDAIFGIGLTRPFEDLPGLRHELLTHHLSPLDSVSGSPIVALDIPSGHCSDSGKPLSSVIDNAASVFAHLTLTFHRPKLGHYLHEGGWRKGELRIVDIGLDALPTLTTGEDYDADFSWEALLTEHGLAADWEKRGNLDQHLVFLANFDAYDEKIGGHHKFNHGHALIVSGGMAKTGAARLAARGALRVGAGLVTVASPPNALMENAAHLTAIMLQKMKGAEGLAEILSDDRINAVVVGPGCGFGEATRALVEVALSGKRTVVLDADALTSYADDPESLFTTIKASPCSVILTPHGGEFARLFPDIAAKLAETPTKGPAYSKVDATREAATRSGATVLYKGADTVIAAPNGQCSIAAAVYERAAPWLATAGSGDVLAGMIAGLAARGISDPAATAAWLHQECGRHIGPGLIAEDIPEAIPSVLKRILDWKAPKD